jgi:hypothetical protein
VQCILHFQFLQNLSRTERVLHQGLTAGALPTAQARFLEPRLESFSVSKDGQEAVRLAGGWRSLARMVGRGKLMRQMQAGVVAPLMFNTEDELILHRGPVSR